jgi:hypothetical protein
MIVIASYLSSCDTTAEVTMPVQLFAQTVVWVSLDFGVGIAWVVKCTVKIVLWYCTLRTQHIAFR